MTVSRRLSAGQLIIASGLSYVVVAAMVIHPVWAHPLHSTVWPEGDASFAIWANGYVAHAIAHIQNPYFSPDLWAPRGVNLLSNTTAVGLAIVFTPVTWVLGPIASFNLQLIVVPALSGMAMVLAVRPWVRAPFWAWFAGLTWAFCPVALESMVWGWTNFLYLATIPLVFWVLDQLLRVRSRTPRFLGVVLAIVVGVQLQIGPEILAICAVVTVAALVGVVIVAGIIDRERILSDRRRVLETSAWFAGAACVTVLVPTIYILSGPSRLPSWIYPRQFLESVSVKWSQYISSPTSSGALHPHWNPVYPSPVFVGWVLVVFFVAFCALLRKEPVVWLLLGVSVFSLWLTRGSAALIHPWTVLWALPVIKNVLALRFIIPVWFAIAFVVALGCDRVGQWARRGERAWWRELAPYAVAALAVSQLAYSSASATQIVVQRPIGDPSISVIAARYPDPLVVTYPFPLVSRAMLQMASGSVHFRSPGGWGPLAQFASPSVMSVRKYFTFNSYAGAPQFSASEQRTIYRVFRAQGVDAATTPISFPYRLNRGYVAPNAFVGNLTLIYGRPVRVANTWVWWLRGAPFRGRSVANSLWRTCVHRVGRNDPASIPSCLLG